MNSGGAAMSHAGEEARAKSASPPTHGSSSTAVRGGTFWLTRVAFLHFFGAVYCTSMPFSVPATG